ncbi:PEP-CTERM sorting domain-containing protein [bacterium]|nr:PEP-CTERM sorting domain-containing protein [bacterium]MDB4577097.1 PEP-CTERM sorting domain-containing protein [bacterium]
MKLRHTKMATLAATLITFGSLAGGANGALILLPNNPASGSHTITLDPVIFTTVSAGDVEYIIFEDFFSSNNVVSGDSVSSTLIASIDGGPTIALGTNSSTGIFSGTFGELDPNDLFINLDSTIIFAVNVGQKVTISGSAVFSSASLAALNTGVNHTGVLANTDLVALSNATPIPESSSVLLLGAGAISLVFCRRRKNQSNKAVDSTRYSA